MTYEIAMLLLLTCVAVVLFSFERFPADVIGVGLLIALVLLGLIPLDKAFAGFGSDTVVLVAGLLVLTSALERTGVMEIVGGWILRHTGSNSNYILLTVMVATVLLSAFMSNTASTAFFLPIVLGLAKRAKISPSRLLMPLAFSAIVASSLSLISTSTNLVVNGLMLQYNMPAMGLFELTPVGLPIALLGVGYMFFIGRWLIPQRQPVSDNTGYLGQRAFTAEVLILPKSPLVGKTIEQAALGRNLDLNVMNILRKKDLQLRVKPSTVLEAGDLLLVEGYKDNILKIRDIAGLEIKSDLMVCHPNLQAGDSSLVEVILLPGHWLVGRTLENVGLRRVYGLKVVGIHRKGRAVMNKLGRVPLLVGDVLLVQGSRETLTALERERAYSILATVEEKTSYRRQALLAVLIFVAVLLLGTSKLVSMPIAVLIGCMLLALTRCLLPEQAYAALNWKAIILIGSMLGLGVAMEETGTASFLAGLVAKLAGGSEPWMLLAGFFVFTVLLTQPMSNQAAAVVVFPVAFQTATQLGYDPRAFAMTIAIAASCSYLTPLEPSCLIVYGPGRYRFMDFVKVGLPLTLGILVITIWLVPKFWPLVGKAAS